MVQFSLQYEEYKQNFCDGLSALQQNGEMVDVTLAADGHLVRVHRLVLSLASPYLKELLATASDCKHPVVFLNKISFPILSSILEYMYTGQVVLSQDQLPDLLQVAKELRIKGLQDMAVDEIPKPKIQLVNLRDEPVKLKPLKGSKIGKYGSRAGISENETVTSQAHIPPYNISFTYDESVKQNPARETDIATEPRLMHTTHMDDDIEQSDTEFETDMDDSAPATKKPKTNNVEKVMPTETIPSSARLLTGTQSQGNPTVQYTVSNSGALQMIVNRYIYFIRYASRKGNGVKNWRCINYFRARCPARIITKNDIVTKRSGTHNHEYHDKKILKKVQANKVFATANSVISKQKAVQSKDGNQSEQIDE